MNISFLNWSILSLVIVFDTLAAAQETWCGKNYKQGQREVEPGGRYKPPGYSSDPLLLFRCETEIKPYIRGEDETASVVVDIGITHQQIEGTFPLPQSILNHLETLGVTYPDTGIHKSSIDDQRLRRMFEVTLGTTDNHTLATEIFPLGMKQRLSFSLDQLQPRKRAYDIQCRIHLASRHLPNDPVVHQVANSVEYVPDAETSLDRTVVTQLRFLPPNPHGGSTIKLDVIRSVLLVKDQGTGTDTPEGSTDSSITWKPLIPFGFYTAFDNYLATNLSILDEAKEKGFNFVHPVPTFANQTALNMVLSRMEDLGLWFIYDMRWHYKNHSALTEQVNDMKSRKNLLVWYTADEPDGWGDDLDAPKSAAEWIDDLDGYHPVSLVLNCNNYHLFEYSRSTDILLLDTYPIGINATHSTVYDTPCTPSFGDCGCDECEGRGVGDVSTRITQLNDMLWWMGERKAVWGVIQAFGEQSFWNRYPTGREFTAMTMIYFIHGATGISPWISPTSTEIMDAASRIAKAIPRITTFFADPKTARFTPKVELISDDLQEELLLVGHSGTSPSFLSSSWSEEDDDAMGRGFAIAQWYIPNQGTLLIFVNLLDKPQTVSILPVHGSPSTSTSTSTEILLSEGVKVRKGMSEVGSSLLVDVEATGSAIVVLT